jgi:hypothetical protein
VSATEVFTTIEQVHDNHGPGVGIYLAFVPWVLFTLIAQHDSD